MTKRKQAQKSLKNEIKEYDVYLKRAAVVAKLVPDIEQRKREAQARLMFFNEMPDEIIDEFSDKLYENQKNNEEQAKLHLPTLPMVSRESIRVLASGTSSSSDYIEITHTYRRSVVLEVPEGILQFQGQQEYTKVEMVYDMFSKLSEERARSQTLPPRLNRISKNLGKKFRIAQASYDKAKNGILGVDQSAIQLRDVLEQLWGGLVILIRNINPRKYNKAELKLNSTGKAIAVKELANTEANKKKLADLLEKASRIHKEISDTNFGKNPMADNQEKLAELYELWQSVVSDIADYVFVNVRIKALRVNLK